MGATRAGRSAEGGLAPAMAARAYDRIGRLQDTQAPIERAAVERMVVAGRLRDARAIFELGCGTGALARRLLSDVLPDSATYVGADVSPRMVALACRRLEPWPQRSRVVQLDGTLPLPVPDGCADRFVAAYVLDLLEPAYARSVLRDAHRVLGDGGLLCVSSLTWGRSLAGRAVSATWAKLWRVAPSLVGGCRPVSVKDLLGPEWQVEEDVVVESWGVASEIVIATRDPQAVRRSL